MKSMRPFFATCTAAVIGAVLLGVTLMPAKAADDEDKPIDERLLGAFLEGLGLERERPPINYQERPPLVIPPTKSLPEPEKGDAVASNPAWPKDPDVMRRRELAKQHRERNTTEEIERESRPLLPDQIGAQGGANTRVVRGDSNSKPFDERQIRMSPAELGYTGGPFGIFRGQDKVVKFTGEPPRTQLTEPPVGYQTPSAEQPYGPAGPERPKAVDSYATHGEMQGNR
jgi:hypothetical protein